MKLSNGIRLVVCQCPLEELDLEPCPLIAVLQSGNSILYNWIVVVVVNVIYILTTTISVGSSDFITCMMENGQHAKWAFAYRYVAVYVRNTVKQTTVAS